MLLVEVLKVTDFKTKTLFLIEDFPNNLTTVTLKCLVITVQIEMQSGHAIVATD